jgi:pyruvate dehydrogenase E1 component alpha subunit
MPDVPLTRERGLALLGAMIRIRRFEEKAAELYAAGKIRGFLHLCIGEEATAVGVLSALGPEDAVVSTYREHGHALARGVPMDRIMAEMFGKLEGTSRGRGGSMHLFDASRRFHGGNAIVAGGIPIAVGLALADAMQARPRVTAAIFGDGAAAEGELYESLNLAALWKLPVVFVCENNGYAMGTALARYQAQPHLPRKAEAMGVPGERVDGMDVLAALGAVEHAVAHARGGGPFLVELMTYRFRAHSAFDAELYRDKKEVELWRQRCPIAAFAAKLRAAGLLDDAALAAIEAEVAAEIAAAVAFAEAGTLEPVSDLHRFVHTETGQP